MVPTDDGASPAPIDRPVLARMRSRFVRSQLVDSAEIVEEDQMHLLVQLSGEYYPDETAARIEIRWYRNDDFSVHYQEERPDSAWRCRWDRHPNAHNTRDHFHPPPAPRRTDAEDQQWPEDHREVSRLVFDRIEERIQTLWEQ